MDANTKPVNPRMNRIRIVSRMAKIVMLGLLVFTLYRTFFLRVWSNGGFSLSESHPTASLFWYRMVATFFYIVLLVWYWKLFRLFNLYEHGLIFSAQTIRCIKILGMLCVVGWVLGAALQVLPHPLPPGASVVRHGYRMGFFSFDFGTGMDVGLLFAGIVIVLIAWIMDEGRKIQEEQELTV